MSAIEDLKDLVVQLEIMYEKEYKRLDKLIDMQWTPRGDQTPEDMVDTQGRSILLDARLRILEAKIVLARYEENNVSKS